MAKNTGRGSRLGTGGPQTRSGAITGRDWPAPAEQMVWTDEPTRSWVVWSEPEGVAVYEGEKEHATRRRLLTPGEARELARLLKDAADEVEAL